MELSPYPMVYVPDGAPKPTHLAPGSVHHVHPGQGPDRGSKGGTLFGPYPEQLAAAGWTPVPAEVGGWWILMQGQLPQDLRRLETSPQIRGWVTIAGAQADQWWRVPQLLRLEDSTQPRRGYLSALDRVWRGGDVWEADPLLASLQRTLLALALRSPVAATPSQRNQVLHDTARQLLTLGHHVSDAELILGGWLSDRVKLSVLYAALGRIEVLEQDGLLHV